MELNKTVYIYLVDPPPMQGEESNGNRSNYRSISSTSKRKVLILTHRNSIWYNALDAVFNRPLSEKQKFF